MSSRKSNIQYFCKKIAKPEVFSQSLWMMKLINKFMYQGKKFIVEKAFFNAFYGFRRIYLQSRPFFILFRNLIRYKPLLGLIKIRKGRQVKMIPVSLSSKRQIIMIFTWFVRALRLAYLGSLQKKLTQELINLKINKKNCLKRFKAIQEYYYHITEARVNNRYRWQ